MARYGSYGPRDEQAVRIGDPMAGGPAFVGLDMITPPGQVMPGFLSALENGRLEYGGTRKGCVSPAWANPPDANPPFFGSGIYSDPDGVTYLMVAEATRVRLYRDGGTWLEVLLPGGVQLTGPVDLVQAFDAVVLFRGDGLAPLYWDGSFTGPFTDLPAPSEDTHEMPNASTGEYYANRLLVPFGRDGVAISDILSVNSFAVDNEFQINSGSDDKLVRLFPWQRNSILAIKDQSVHVITNATGEFTDLSLELVHSVIGAVGRRAVTRWGADVALLSQQGGVYLVGQLFEDSPAASSVPVSEPIRPIIERINWPHASGACAISLGVYVYFAVPLDDSPRNNRILVFDLVRAAWSGVDSFGDADFAIDAFHLVDYHGRKFVAAVDYTAGTVVLLNEGMSDTIGATEHQIATRFLTRGYTGGEGVQAFRRLHLQWATWNPKISVSLFTAGVLEEQAITTDKTASRSSYFQPFGKADYVATNINDDFATAGREDYSVALPMYLPVVLDHFQEREFSWPVRARGEWCQVEVQCTQGQIRLHNVAVEAQGPERRDVAK